MKNKYPLHTAKREQRRLEKLGTDSPLCILCGCTVPMLLRPVSRALLEKHHVVGVANDPELVLVLCLNCHALLTEGLLQAGVSMKRESDPLKFSANMYRALSVHFRSLGDAFARHAEMMDIQQKESE